VFSWFLVAVAGDVVCIAAGRPAYLITRLPFLLVLPMLSERASKEAACSMRSLVHLFAGSYLMVAYSS